MLVPVKLTKSAPEPSHVALHAVMFVPGAEMSGLRRPSLVGPRLEELFSESFDHDVVPPSLKLPAVTTLNESPGELTEPDDEPELPDAIATSIARLNTTAS